MGAALFTGKPAPIKATWSRLKNSIYFTATPWEQPAVPSTHVIPRTSDRMKAVEQGPSISDDTFAVCFI